MVVIEWLRTCAEAARLLVSGLLSATFGRSQGTRGLGAGISGVFVNGDGQPRVHAHVLAEARYVDGTRYRRGQRTDSIGGFALLDWLPDGQYPEIRVWLREGHGDSVSVVAVDGIEIVANEIVDLGVLSGERTSRDELIEQLSAQASAMVSDK